MAKLKKCMCGGEAIVAFAKAGHYVACEKFALGEPCFMVGHFRTREEAITAWETRPLEAELAGALEMTCNGNRQELIAWLIKNKVKSDRPFVMEKVIVLRMIVVHHTLEKYKSK